MNKRLIHSLGAGALVAAVCCTFGLIRVTAPGISGCSFTLLSCITPLISLYLLQRRSAALFVLLKTLGYAAGLSLAPTLGLPTVAAAMSYRSVNQGRDGQSLFAVGLPLMAVFLFALHPVGGQALAYTAFWLIPPALFAAMSLNLRIPRLLAAAVVSTFVAHAVGSVMWLYTMPTTPTLWLVLISVVAVERLLLAVIVSAVGVVMMVVQRRRAVVRLDCGRCIAKV